MRVSTASLNTMYAGTPSASARLRRSTRRRRKISAPATLSTAPTGAVAVATGIEVERRVDDGGTEAVAHERVHLVLHERDERAQHEHRAGQDAGRDLKRERFTGAGGHDADAVAPGEHGGDDLLLARTELLVAEDAGEHVTG